MPGSGLRCPIAASLNILGDRWSLVIVRDMLVGKKRFSEFLTSSERITSSVLTERLNRLEGAGIVSKAAYQSNPIRYEYELTPVGSGLLPLLQEICRWGNAFLPDTMEPPFNFMDRRS
jgi:DNA-binding HxlR family transcriptional regulator